MRGELSVLNWGISHLYLNAYRIGKIDALTQEGY